MRKRINYKTIGMRNFFLAKDLEFSITPGKHLIMGANGSGKSTLGEALVYNHYKKSIRGKNPSTDYQGNCMTWSEFELEDKSYRIERFYGDEAEGNNCKLYIDNEEVSARLKTSVDKEIPKIIRIPYDLFINTCVVLQGLPMNFSTLGATARKTIVEEMLGFQIWNVYRDKFWYCSREEKLKLNRIKADYGSKREGMISLNSKVETLEEFQTQNLDEVKKDIDELRTKSIKLVEDIRSFQDNLKEQLGVDTLVKIQGTMTALSSKYNHMSNKIKEFQKALDHESCYACGHKMSPIELEKIKEDLGKYRERVIKLRPTIDNLNEKISKVINLNTKLSSVKQDNRSIKGQIISLEQKLESTETNNLGSMKDELDGVNEEVNSLLGELNEFKSSVDILDYLDRLMLPSSKFRTMVLKKYLSSINNIIESVTPLIFQEFTIKLDVDLKDTGLDITVKRNGKSILYDSLSGGQKRRVDIILILSFQKFLLSSSDITTNLLIFDEIFDSVDYEGVQSIINCIDALFQDTSSIYVITHNDKVKSYFSSVIQVSLEKGETKISY